MERLHCFKGPPALGGLSVWLMVIVVKDLRKASEPYVLRPLAGFGINALTMVNLEPY